MENLLFSKKDLYKLIIPLMIEQGLSLAVGMVDTIMVSGISETAVAGVSLVDTINTLFVTLFSALGAGGAIVAGQYLGNRKREQSQQAATQLIYITIIISTVIGLVCILFNSQLLSLCFGDIAPEVSANAKMYFYITAASFPFIAVFNAVAGLFRVMGNATTPMINAIVINIVNIAGNFLLIYIFDFGVVGAAIATLVSRAVVTVIIVWSLRNKKRDIHVTSYKFWKLDLQMNKRILKIAVPNSLENSLFQLGKLIMVSFVATFGTTAITANAVSNSLAGIVVIPGFTFSLAITTVISQCVGAADYEQANYYTKRLLKQSYITTFVLTGAIMIFIAPILNMYNLSDETFKLALYALTIHNIGAVFIWPLSFVLPNTFRAAGDAKSPMFVSVFSMFLFRIGFSFVLINFTDLGMLSVWAAMIVDWTFRSIYFVHRWHGDKWKNRKVI